ncbi:hypothetical protein [Microbacterium sp. W4I4]|uniref:hypothetical protein n=1 Tax=Microbacterium sp. W4I4 TaxID=3042295 RepID=UPI0027D867EA|nr:hypothetical protein [Microbacterium sp. W4I4]
MVAEVVLVTTGTATPAPTAAVPATEMFPAIENSVSAESAETMTLPPARRSAAEPIVDVVVIVMTGTVTLTFTAAVPPPPPPTEIDLKSS